MVLSENSRVKIPFIRHLARLGYRYLVFTRSAVNKHLSQHRDRLLHMLMTGQATVA